MANQNSTQLNAKRINISSTYTLDQYKNDIKMHGMNNVWHEILLYLSKSHNKCGIITPDNIGELYEIGLACLNKEYKKKHGVYYTPIDVACVMSKWFLNLDGTNVCDVCCGVGNLIITYLNTIGVDKAKELLNAGRVYLYEQDELALQICKERICMIYGYEYLPKINCIVGDFLDRNIKLPNNCKIISNPPYFKLKEIPQTWEQTQVVKENKEIYAIIMEKIIKNSVSSVIITPYSFMGGEKFFTLREQMNDYNGFIVSFDNVPGNIFCGQKHGIFNTNLSNSVRASITVVENKKDKHGFRCSNLIRFKNTERSILLNTDILEHFIGNKYQIINSLNKKYAKCNPELESIFDLLIKSSNTTLSNLIDKNGKYALCIPNTCRYYSVASLKDLSRTGKYTISFKTEKERDLVYCLINSSFCYWYWRLYDGGITYSRSLLMTMPIFISKMTDTQINKLLHIAKQMQLVEPNYLTYKKNAGKMQENIKFPPKYREEINNILLNAIGSKYQSDIFDIVHSNTANSF